MSGKITISCHEPRATRPGRATPPAKARPMKESAGLRLCVRAANAMQHGGGFRRRALQLLCACVVAVALAHSLLGPRSVVTDVRRLWLGPSSNLGLDLVGYTVGYTVGFERLVFRSPKDKDMSLSAYLQRKPKSVLWCYFVKRTLKADVSCGTIPPSHPLLVTGTGRSGTSYLKAVFKQAGLQLSHDTGHDKEPHIHGAVSWPHAFSDEPFRKEMDSESLVFDEIGAAGQCWLPNWSWGYHKGDHDTTSNHTRFKNVVHLVRNPIQSINSRWNNGSLSSSLIQHMVSVPPSLSYLFSHGPVRLLMLLLTIISFFLA